MCSSSASPLTATNTVSASSAAASGVRQFHAFMVVGKTACTPFITQFTLETTAVAAMEAWVPGQYLVFKVELDGQRYLRQYSIIDCRPVDVDRVRVRIAVKRELAPLHQAELPAGKVSGYLHDEVQVGDVLQAAGPLGDFVLDAQSARPVVLISAGVGITPVLAMLRQLAQQAGRTTHFIHACENGLLHAFAKEVEQIAASNSAVTVRYCYRQPSVDDIQRAHFSAQGYLRREHLQAWLCLDDYDFYVCGPTPFMQMVWEQLRQLGVAAERIHYEFFGAALNLAQAEVAAERAAISTQGTSDSVAQVAVMGEHTVAPVDAETPSASQACSEAADVVVVSFVDQGMTQPWNNFEGSLLEFAESQGLEPNFNCRSGLCNSCMCTLVSGEVSYIEDPLDIPPEGKVLLCCAQPKTKLELDLSDALD